MKFGPASLRHVLSLSLVTLFFCATSLLAQKPTFISFDAPDAGVGNLNGTIPVSINQKGVVAGYYLDKNSVSHGFFRQASGQITEFDVSGMTNPNVACINSAGQIVGNARRNNVTHGWLRNPNGRFVIIDPPGSTFTSPAQINDNGEIAGTFEDAALALHGFLRDASGNYTIIDDPNGSGGGATGTQVFALNANGVTAGNYPDENTAGIRAFVRDQFGTFTNFDPVTGGALEVFPIAVNLSGEITGSYYNSDFVTHTFIRDPSGVVTDFDMPNATGTFPTGMNASNTIVGQWSDSSFNTRGFLRSSTGTANSFSVPWANQGTYAQNINDVGKVTGYYFDLNNTVHGFLK